MLSSPPDGFIGADKLFAEARFGNIKGPLKLGALRTSRWTLSAGCWFSISDLNISKW